LAKNKHLTYDERLQIENLLKSRTSLKRIATVLGKSTSTISREIRAHSTISDKSAPYRVPNRCLRRKECSKHYLCENKPDCVKKCSLCKLCNSMCADFEEETCHNLAKPPYVCNGCESENACVLRRRYYRYKPAHETYRLTLVESRTGVNISEGELISLDSFVSPLVINGQSVHHIFANNPSMFRVSEKSVYRYINGGLLRAKNIDMPRVCRIKPRKRKPVEHKVDSKCRIGRSYEDFLSHINCYGPANTVEMDSVIGRIGGKVLHTLLFKSCDLMLAFLCENNTAHFVSEMFNHIFDSLGLENFRLLFPVILTDNGSEFSNPKAIEFDDLGNQRSKVFYCHPYSSYEKPNVELNHEFIRRILPKGFSFDHLMQGDIDLMMSHINSYSREKLNDKSPYDVFSFLYGSDVLGKFGIIKIPANDIVLRPSLLKAGRN